MAKLNPDQIQSLSTAISQMRGDSEKVQANIEKALASQSRGVRKLERQFKKMRISNIKEIRRTKKAIEDLVSGWDSATEAEKKQLPILNQTLKDYKKANSAIIALTQAKEDERNETNMLSRAYSQFSRSVGDFLNPLNLLSAGVSGIIGLYQNWYRLQTLTHNALGEATQALGGTSAQMDVLRQRAEGMRDMFFHVDGAVDGIQITMQQATQVSLAMRESLDELGQGAVSNMAMASRAFGMSHDQIASLFRIVESGTLGANDSMEELLFRVSDFAEDIGGNPAQVARDFQGLAGELTRFGTDGEMVFQDMAMMANEFGFETRRIFDMMRGFDTFSQASTNVNQLNAMLGTTLSSYEMMMETNPAERLEMIRQQIQSTGMQWGELGYHAQGAIQEMLGMSGEEAAQVFGNNISLDELREQQASAERERQQRQNRMESAQDRLLELFNRTSTVVRTWREHLQHAYNVISERLAPIFNVLRTHAEEIWHEIQNFVDSLSDGESATNWIQTAADWLDKMLTQVRGYDWGGLWDRIQRTWREWQPTILNVKNWIGEMLQRVRDVNWPKLWARINQLWIDFRGYVDSARNSISSVVSVFRTVWSVAQPILSRIGNMITSIANGAMAIWQAFQRIVGAVNSMNTAVMGENGGMIGMLANLVGSPSEETDGRTRDRNMRNASKNTRQAAVRDVANNMRNLARATAPGTQLIESAVDSVPSVGETAEQAANLQGTVLNQVIEMADIVLQWNGREFARGQIEAALRNT